MAVKKKQAEAVLSFEEALQELEKLTTSMESDRLSLDELIEHYERGSDLLKHCETSLDLARKKIELIQAKAESPKEPALETPSDPEPNEQDVRLF